MGNQQGTDQKLPFHIVYEKYYEIVFRYIHRKIDNYHDAQDLTSEAFTYCYQHYHDYDPEKSAVSTWLYLVVNSRIKNYYRDKKTMVDVDALDGILTDDRIDMDACICLEQIRARLSDAIAHLPERQRQAVILRYFGNCSGAEIAARLGTTQGNARVILNRALKQLEKQCRDLLEERR